jgi:uroporphyrinogen III methyltransferase/synthase
MMKPQGIVYLVGAGPGDVGLFTLRGMELLRQAEVVVYDGLVNPDLLRFAPATAEIICADKHNRSRCVSQEQINRLLLAKAQAGKRVVRLKGGDPCMFGRGGEEAEMLAGAGIAFEMVPGVSSVQSVPAYAGIPLTHRRYNSSVTVVTGHEHPSSPLNKLDWAQLARVPGTLVVLMGLRNLRPITAALIAGGRAPETPAAVISQGTTPRQRTVTGTLATIAALVEQSRLPAPAVTVIGEVVNLREKVAWFERHNGASRLVLPEPSVAAPTSCVPAARYS